MDNWRRVDGYDSPRRTHASTTVTLTTTSASSMGGSMAQPIAHFISMKVVESPVSTLWKRAVVPMSRVETIVHVAVEAMGAVEPGTGSDKDTAVEPFRPVVSVRGAAIWSIVEVTVWTSRRYSDIDSDSSRCRARDTQQSSCQDS
jgi:hypothetical protein